MIAEAPTGMEEGSLDFRLLVWTQSDNVPGLSSDLNVQVNEALAQAGIRSAVPQRDLHVRSVAPGAALVVDGIESPAQKTSRSTS